MSTYLVLDLVFLGLVAAVAVAAALVHRAPRWRAVGLALVVLVLLTAVFDNVIVGLGIVDYAPGRILGVRFGVAPVEDVAYAIAAAVLLPSLWMLLPDSRRMDERARARSERRRPAREWDEKRP